MAKTILNIRVYPDPILKKKAEPVQEISKLHQRLIKAMIETMYAAPGIGLAAPQIGISQRLIVIRFANDEKKEDPLALINPRILQRDGEKTEDEGCLSFPDVSVSIKRSFYVKVAYEDIQGKTRHIEGTDLLARVLQHEIDHLDGIVLTDYMGRIKRDLVKRKFRKKPPQAYPVTADPEYFQVLKA